jgi:hypothetical protein
MKNISLALLGLVLGAAGVTALLMIENEFRVSRDGDFQQMSQMSQKFSTAIEEGIRNDELLAPITTASWSCIFAREMAYVRGGPPRFSTRSPDEDHPRFYKPEGWHEKVRSSSLRADRKVYFNEQEYNAFIENVLGTDNYAEV